MRDDVLGAIRAAVGSAFEILGEMGRDGDQAVAYLAREHDTGGLVALKLEKEADGSESDLSLSVRRQLDATVPAQAEQCAHCRTVVRSWTRYCPHCTRDLSGLGHSDNTRQEQLVAEARRAAAGRYELLGEMPRAEGGRPVFFARQHDTGEIVALRLDKESAAGGDRFSVSVTQMLRAVRPGAAAATAGGRGPAVRFQDTAGRGSVQQPAAASAGPRPDRSDAPLYFCPACGAEYEAGIWFCPRDGSSVKPKHSGPDLVGRIVAGRYRVIRKIGEGGMGQVYFAEHVRIGKGFALKIMNPALKSDPESLGRFGREAAHASRIDHPNVATVQDFGESEDGLIYLAMEFAEGTRLTEILVDGAIAPARAAEIGRQIADALAAAHGQGIVHRDLKPDNVIVEQRPDRDVIKVVDFGIAKAIETEASQKLTRTGFVVGTPRYMSPEQIIADPVDGRSDIYSLGCMMYEMLVGEPVFSGPTGESMITKRLTEPPPSPRRKNPRIPKDLDQVVLRSLARSRNDRFASAAEMRDALAKAARGAAGSRTPLPAPRVTPASRPGTARSSVHAAPFSNDRLKAIVARVPRRAWAAAAGVFVLVAVATLAWPRGEDEPLSRQPNDSKLASVPPVTPPAAVKADSAAPALPEPRVSSSAPNPAATAARESTAVRSPPPNNQRAERPGAQVQPNPTRTETSPVRQQTPPITQRVQRDSPSAVRADPVRPPPPTVPGVASVDSVRDMLARAIRLKDAGDYPGAFGSFRAAQTRLGALRAAFPTAAVLNTLDREYADRLRSTVNACQAYREVRTSLGLPPPDCSVGN